MGDRPRLALLRRDGSWFVDYAETQERATILNLFGTTLVVTPYTVRAEATTVCAAIQKLNPQYSVEVMADGTTTGDLPCGCRWWERHGIAYCANHAAPDCEANGCLEPATETVRGARLCARHAASEVR